MKDKKTVFVDGLYITQLYLIMHHKMNDHMVIWSYGHMVIWSYGHMVIWPCGHVVMWSYGHMVIWSYGT